ncbi:tyrosine-type recombinase/integrase [Streptomyces sp. TLI_146]|uniref:tyrosine-type recombinase/integrase n=1 Tax=Streptomyces sp. TLI_146 TaxID=1938858 RepID=UPI0015D5BDCC|nr:tyrosine-type recombinase/integrase [Streptomyces sp. TLI_146]
MGTFFKECDHPEDRWSKCPHPYTIRFRDATGRQREEGGYTNQDKAKDRLIAIYQTKKGPLKSENTESQQIAEMRFEDFAARYISNRKRGLASNTVDQYEGSLKVQLNPRLGSRRIGTFTPGAIEDCLGGMELDKVGLASQKNAYLVLKLVIDAARHRGAISLDPFLDVAPPDYVPKEVIIPSLEELTSIREAAEGDDLRMVIELMSGCGHRNGEAHAANIKAIVADDVYRISEQIHGNKIQPAALKHRKRGEFRETPLPRKTHDFFTYFTDTYGADKNGYVLTKGNGAGSLRMKSYFYGDQTLRWRWNRCLERAGVSARYTMYSLRHYFASNCLSHGIPITDVAEWMGHKSIEVTYRIYRHLLPGSISRAAKILNDGL